MVDVGFAQMHVMETGPEDGPVVVLAHGNPTWGFLYRKVMAAAADSGLRLVAPDLIGLGLSSRPTDPRAHTLAQHGRWMGALLDTLPGPLVAVGQDWGGPVLLRALCDRSERMAGLVVLNTVLGPPKPGFTPTLFHKLTAKPGLHDGLVRRLNVIERAMPLAQGNRGSISGDVAAAYRWPLRRMADNQAPLALARMVPNDLQHPSIADLERVGGLVTSFEGPTAIVWGRNDPVLGKLLRRSQRMLPHAKVTATNAGHFLQEEVPEEIAAAIIDIASQASGGS
ncbi:MAG: alpha/beta fold hydrolase [Myxococcales bacterium]|nr:alpha/beta fold hydrolase [Myxococcales bacterium]